MDPTKRPILDKFGKLMIEQVRDDACTYLTWLLTGEMADKTSRQMFRQFKKLKLKSEDRDTVARIVTEAINAGIVRFLNFLDVNEIKLLFRDKAGKDHDICAISDGLVGEMYTDDGWIAKFSRFKDGLKLDE